MYSPKSKVDVYNGLGGIETVFNDIVATKKELVGWGATDRARQLLPDFTNDYIRRREEHNVRARQLAVEGGQVLETPYSKFKYIPREYSSPATTLIYGNKVAVMMWFSEPVLSIRITNREIADAYRHHFEFLWGTKLFSPEEILASQVVRQEIERVFGNKKTTVVNRKTSRIIRLGNEPNDIVQRIILLPPGGSTAGEYSGELADHDRFSPHPEAISARVTIRGGVAPGRMGFRKIDRAIKYAYFTRRDISITDKKYYREEYKSSHTPPFQAVKANGSGFWHTIINTSNEWVLLTLEKKLVAAAPLEVDQLVTSVTQDQRQRVETLIKNITERGDHIFLDSTNPLAAVEDVSEQTLARLLIVLLNVPDRANHEPCTAVALLIKLGRKHPDVVLRELRQAREHGQAPRFYLDEVVRKLEKI